VLAGHGQVAQADMDRTFNLGVGMTAIVAAEAVQPALALLGERDLPAWVLGEIVEGSGQARFR
jgi:phosphoribosylformylglycinamidine cyclo-ligase